MKNTFSLLLLVTVVLFSCKTADNKVPQIAADFCNCFSKLEKDMSAESKKVFTTAAESVDPEKVLEEEITKLDEETQTKVATEFMALGELEDDNSEVGRCIKNVEKKYDNAYTLNQSKFLDKVIKELEQKPGCSFTASLMKLGKKVEEKEKGK
jgi:hypothetical protein